MVGDADHAAPHDSRSRSKCDADLVRFLPAGVVSGVTARRGSGEAAAAVVDAGDVRFEGSDRLVTHVSLRASLLAGSEEGGREACWFGFVRCAFSGSDPGGGGRGCAAGEERSLVDCGNCGGRVYDGSAGRFRGVCTVARKSVDRWTACAEVA